MPRAGGATRAKKDPTDDFFTALGERGHEPLLASATGTLRFDLVRGRRVEHWFVSIDKGDVRVSQKESRASAVVRLDRAIFDRMVTGRMNAMAATLRGVLEPEGDLGLVLLFQRLFPGPPVPRRKRPAGTNTGGSR